MRRLFVFIVFSMSVITANAIEPAIELSVVVKAPVAQAESASA